MPNMKGLLHSRGFKFIYIDFYAIIQNKMMFHVHWLQILIIFTSKKVTWNQKSSSHNFFCQKLFILECSFKINRSIRKSGHNFAYFIVIHNPIQRECDEWELRMKLLHTGKEILVVLSFNVYFPFSTSLFQWVSYYFT